MRSTGPKNRYFYLVIVAMVVTVIELGSFMVLQLVLVPRGYVYKPKLVQTSTSYAEYQQQSLAPGGLGVDGAALHSSPSGETKPLTEPSNVSVCVSLYGDSFTADSRWGETIAAIFGCHVANYGVPGFGIDQALMRFEAVSNDTADVVVLSFFSEDIARHVTRNFDVWVYQPSHFGASVFAPKARYILGLNGELQHLPAQIMTFSEFEAAVRDPAQHIEHDYLAAGGASGLPIWRCPWTFTLARVFSHWKVRAKLAGLPWYGQLFLAGHPSQALEISTRIVERFVDVAQRRGKRSVIQLLPSILDFRHYSKSQTWPYQPLIDALASRDIEVHNLGEEMLEKINIEQACKLFDTGESSGLDDCGGHFSDLGYEILARHTAARIGAL